VLAFGVQGTLELAPGVAELASVVPELDEPGFDEPEVDVLEPALPEFAEFEAVLGLELPPGAGVQGAPLGVVPLGVELGFAVLLGDVEFGVVDPGAVVLPGVVVVPAGGVAVPGV